MPSRRDLLLLLGATTLPLTGVESKAASNPARKPLRVRTITAGVDISQRFDLSRIETALGFLKRTRKQFEDAGYEVQTLRIATSPWSLPREQSLRVLQELDQAVLASGAIASIGPVLAQDRADAGLAAWGNELVRTTRAISFSVAIASDHGVHREAATAAAQTMVALARTLPDGVGNFRFAAAANIPAGTPFFPVAWHQGADSFAVGLEAASVVEEAAADARDAAEITDRVRARFDSAFAPIEKLCLELERRGERSYGGIDASPAPAKDRSIAAAIEALTHTPFGSAGTLDACAAITAALKSLHVKTCGYSGLMLPVLEDPVLAQRAGEHRYGIRDLLLYSSVCGTGLDVVPIAGDTSVASIAALLRDVAALSVKLRKPLSARLFVVPGKGAGDVARFTDPLLTDSMVMKLD